MTRLFALFVTLAASALAGCSSLVDDHCARGYLREDGTCIVPPEDVDGGIGVVADARMSVENMPPDPVPAPDANPSDGAVADGGGPTCTAPLVSCDGACVDLETDPDHCGSCTHQCASGICVAGHCSGEPWGHIVAIGHDYVASHAAQRRVLANAVALGAGSDVAVAWFPTESPSLAHVPAMTAGMAALGRPWHQVAFPANPAASFAGIDVVIVAPDDGDGDVAEATGTQWAAALDGYLRTGGVIVVLDGAAGVNHRFAHGAQLFDVGAPVVATGQPTAVVDGTDAVANQVIAPYLAESTSVTWPGAPEPVVTTMGATGTIVFHLTR